MFQQRQLQQWPLLLSVPLCAAVQTFHALELAAVATLQKAEKTAHRSVPQTSSRPRRSNMFLLVFRKTLCIESDKLSYELFE